MIFKVLRNERMTMKCHEIQGDPKK